MSRNEKLSRAIVASYYVLIRYYIILELIMSYAAVRYGTRGNRTLVRIRSFTEMVSDRRVRMDRGRNTSSHMRVISS